MSTTPRAGRVPASRPRARTVQTHRLSCASADTHRSPPSIPARSVPAAPSSPDASPLRAPEQTKTARPETHTRERRGWPRPARVTYTHARRMEREPRPRRRRFRPRGRRFRPRGRRFRPRGRRFRPQRPRCPHRLRRPRCPRGPPRRFVVASPISVRRKPVARRPTRATHTRGLPRSLRRVARRRVDRADALGRARISKPPRASRRLRVHRASARGAALRRAARGARSPARDRSPRRAQARSRYFRGFDPVEVEAMAREFELVDTTRARRSSPRATPPISPRSSSTDSRASTSWIRPARAIDRSVPFGPGALIGEMALWEGGVRSADVVAAGVEKIDEKESTASARAFESRDAKKTRSGSSTGTGTVTMRRNPRGSPRGIRTRARSPFVSTSTL